MEHLSASGLFGMLFVILVAAKTGGFLATRLGQPAVLGELVAGVVVGQSGLSLVHMHFETMHLLSEMGVFLLLLAIGLETNLRDLLRVGITSVTVAAVGVVLPFVLGYLACLALGLPSLPAIMAGAALTATSVGITARVLSDLGRLKDVEGQVIIGAAVLDDILGLVILTVVTGLAHGEALSLLGIAKTTVIAFGFLAIVIAAGSMAMPFVTRLVSRVELPGTPVILCLILAFGLAWFADRVGSAMILGAFAAGLLIAGSPQAEKIEHGVTTLGHLFVPIFFVGVGASVDLGSLNPAHSEGRFALLVGLVLIIVGVFGKLFAGYAPVWFKGNKTVVGVGMIPRGEVGLIFANMGKTAGVFTEGQFSGITMMVLVTTFIAPPLLKRLLTPRPSVMKEDSDGIEELVMDA